MGVGVGLELRRWLGLVVRVGVGGGGEIRAGVGVAVRGETDEYLKDHFSSVR